MVAGSRGGLLCSFACGVQRVLELALVWRELYSGTYSLAPSRQVITLSLIAASVLVLAVRAFC